MHVCNGTRSGETAQSEGWATAGAPGGGESGPLFFDFGMWWHDVAPDCSGSPVEDEPMWSSAHQMWAHAEGDVDDPPFHFATLADLIDALVAEGLVVRTFDDQPGNGRVDGRTPVAIGAEFSALCEFAESAGWEKVTTDAGSDRAPFSIETANENPDFFAGWKDKSTFFSSGERIQLIVYHIQTVPKLNHELLSFRSCTSFFPLHSLHGNTMLAGAVVYDVGSRFGLGGLSDELEDHVVDYFGPSLGFYFGFLSFYTQGLLLPAVVGVYVHMTDHKHAGYLSCLQLLVATFFVKAWRRHESALATRWLRFAHASAQVGQIRPPNFARSVRVACERHLGTTLDSLHMQQSTLVWLLGKALSVTLHTAAVTVTCSAVLALHYLDEVFPRLVKQHGLEAAPGTAWALVIDYVPTLLFVAGLAVIEPGLDWLCKQVTDWESHPTTVAYRSALARKRIEAKFFLRHSSLFWTAYYVQNATMLTKVLKTYVVLYALTSTIVEVVKAKLPRLRANATATAKRDLYSHVVQNGQLAPYSSTFEEYLKLYTQFGQVLMFSAFFPLAPACAWVANMLESRLDGYKLLQDIRRPLPLTHCPTGIGSAWTEAFQTVVYLSVVTNLSSIALFAPPEFWARVTDGLRGAAAALEIGGVAERGALTDRVTSPAPFWLKAAVLAVVEHAIFYALWKLSQLPDTAAATMEKRIEKEVRWRKAIDAYNKKARIAGKTMRRSATASLSL